MWSCCMRNKEDYGNEEGKKVEEIIKTCSSLKLEEGGMKKKKKKKKVSFKVQNGNKGNHCNSTNGPLRIRLVVTKEELKRMLRNKNEDDAPPQTSLEELLSDMKLRERKVFDVNSWRPALESIPENRSMK
ncbi:hypothetical protein RJT34_28795 [Clitoria ternatea]|uniref:Uncharacterized protein n=1 Tax=Clitoria ternatea TaxID=43366 RepID=A0AAN9F984_CLITE